MSNVLKIKTNFSPKSDWPKVVEKLIKGIKYSATVLEFERLSELGDRIEVLHGT